MQLLTRRSVRSALILGLPLLGLCALSGCGEAEEKVHRVSGTVTFEGQPIAKGLIFFDPDASKGTDGGQGFANILQGKYDTAAMGKGVRGGFYHVRVNGFDGVEANEAPFGQALFPEFNGAAELPASESTYNLDVPTPQSRDGL